MTTSLPALSLICLAAPGPGRCSSRRRTKYRGSQGVPEAPPCCVTSGQQLHLSGLLPILHQSMHTQLNPKGRPHASCIYQGQWKGESEKKLDGFTQPRLGSAPGWWLFLMTLLLMLFPGATGGQRVQSYFLFNRVLYSTSHIFPLQ